MISYAQNAEDVVLARALPQTPGFYVDVGAADPEIASVTKHFYDLGWSGVNIDPRCEAVARLSDQRPRDVNLCVAAHSSDAVLVFHQDVDDPDQSTTEDAGAGDLEAGGHRLQSGEVQARTLNSILAQHVPAGTHIDFLKIDVEGAESAVLAGLDLTRWRPTIVVVEAVKPWSTERTDHQWRHFLDENNYQEVLFDGLNLFFVAGERARDIGTLSPASVLDQYTPASVELLNEEIVRLRGYVWHLEATLQRESAVHDDESVSLTSPAPVHIPVQRFLVVGPVSATADSAKRIAGRLGGSPTAVEHPADIDWDALGTTEVLQLDWPPSRLLSKLLRAHHFQVVLPESPANPSNWPADRREAWAQRASTLTERELDRRISDPG